MTNGTHEEYRGMEKDDTPISVEDIHMGVDIYREKGNISLQEFANLVYNRIDFNRFDYEGGELDMLTAVMYIQFGYVAAGGVLDDRIPLPDVVE